MEAASLDNLRAESERRYADYPVSVDNETTVVLRAPLRLPSEQRTTVRKLQSAMQGLQDQDDYAEDDVMNLLREMVRTVADDRSKADSLVEAVGDDLALLQTLFESYTERTQPGEASNSAS